MTDDPRIEGAARALYVAEIAYWRGRNVDLAGTWGTWDALVTRDDRLCEHYYALARAALIYTDGITAARAQPHLGRLARLGVALQALRRPYKHNRYPYDYGQYVHGEADSLRCALRMEEETP